MPRTLDCLDEHPLVAGTCPRDPFWDNASLLRDESLKLLLVLVIDVDVFVFAEPANALLPYLGSSLVWSPLVGAPSPVASLRHAAPAALRPPL